MNSPAPDPLDGEQPHVEMTELQAQHTIDGATIADLAAANDIDRSVIAQLEADGVVDRRKIADLEAALVSCRRIGAALGIIMATQKITEEQAFQVLRAASQSRNRKLREIADDVLLAGTIE